MLNQEMQELGTSMNAILVVLSRSHISVAASEVRQKLQRALQDGREPIEVEVTLLDGELLVRILRCTNFRCSF